MIEKIYYLIFLLLLGCSASEKRPSGVLFAGEIVNPTDKYVVFYKDDEPLDSVALDKDNMFFFDLNNIEEGLYHFNHSPQIQYVFVEKGDSLVLRLNTVAFDESLIFSGKGSEINNFLLEIFLKNEEEETVVNSFYHLDPNVFIEKIDSLRAAKYQMLDVLLANVDLSKKALMVAKASIDYNAYIAKEKYPFRHRTKTGEASFHELPDNFYDYRKNISYNNKDLTYFRPYYNFMKYHFGNLSYMACVHNCDISGNEVKDKLHYNGHTLSLIDSLVVNKNLRDNLFRNVAIDYFLKAKDNMVNNKAFIDQFLRLSANNKHIEEITHLYEGIKNLQPNNELPTLTLRDIANTNIEIKELAKKKNVVFYFWSGSQMGHFNKTAATVKDLSSKYPDYTFIGLNWNTDPQQWSNLIASKQLDAKLQYRINNFDEMAKALIFDDFNKAIIVREGVITNGFANLYTTFK